jgi:hypothetical protein
VPASKVGKGKGGARTPSNTYILAAHTRLVNLCCDALGKNASECADVLHTLMHDLGRSAWQYELMIRMCRRCGHRVRAEGGVADGRGALSYVDDERTSGSYGKHVARCPGCGQRLVVEDQGSPPVTVSLTARELAETLGIPAEAARALVSSAVAGGGRRTK